jgi:N-acetylneuraminic acid mutarotase
MPGTGHAATGSAKICQIETTERRTPAPFPMKKSIRFFAIMTNLLGSSILPAAVPGTINYQGRVAVQGVNFNGTGLFKFALVDAGTPFGDTATATAVVAGGAVTAVNVDQTGTNYASPPAITFGGPGTGATATAELNLGIVITITVTNGGEGYTTPPTVTIAPPPTQTVYYSYWSNDGTSSVGDAPAAAVSIPVTNGLYSVALGEASGMSAFPAELFKRPLRLRVWFSDGVHDFEQLTPDHPLASSPYAFHAQTAALAETVPAGAIQSIHLANGAVTASSIAVGAVGAEQLVAGSVNSSHLAPGTAAEIMRATGSNVMAATDEAAPGMVAAGYVKVGSQTFTAESWAAVNVLTTPHPTVFHAKSFAWGGAVYVFGTSFSTVFSSGVAWRFDPAAQQWTQVPFQGLNALPSFGTASMVWTGTELLFFGVTLEGGVPPAQFHGYYGAIAFNPATGVWRRLSAAGSPAARFGQTAVWTGSKMIVFGGCRFFDPSTAASNATLEPQAGGVYDIGTDTWTVLNGGPVGRMNASAVWSGTEMIVWGGFMFQRTGFISEFAAQGSGAAWNAATGVWRTLPSVGAPAARYSHTAQMTAPGGKMLILGGTAGATGAAYDTAADSWSPISSAGFPAGTSFAATAWTDGALYWACGATQSSSPDFAPGYLPHHSEFYVPPAPSTAATGNLFARYDPVANTWTNISGPGAPAAANVTAGASEPGKFFVYRNDSDGGVSSFDIATATWQGATPAPVIARQSPAAVWTGTEVLYWGGFSSATPLRSGGRFKPTTNLHTTIPLGGAPSGWNGHSAVWTGSEMIIWGGRDGTTGDNYFLTGAAFNATTGTWTALGTANAPAARREHTAVWTGTEMIVWGGVNGVNGTNRLDSGAKYEPITGTWTTLSGFDAPSPRSGHSAVWTGSEMIIWGGSGAGGALGDGARYHPATNSWTTISAVNAPAARTSHTAVWTGSEMIVWGGINAGLSTVSSGARYHPGTDTWTALPVANAPEARVSHTAVWSGKDMIVWGGLNGQFGSALFTGARYAPESNTWTTTADDLVATQRYGHVAFWTGGSMHVLFGRQGPNYFADVLKYTPPVTVNFFLAP